MSDNTESEEELEHVEYGFAIPAKGAFKNFAKRHNELATLLNLPPQDDFLQLVYKTLITLCDPYTQPEETEKYILSVGCISDLLISISYSSYTESISEELEIDSIKFAISTTFFYILQAVHKVLNADDEVSLRFVDNGADNWKQHVKGWTPRETNTFNLNLLYSMACVLIMSIQKLFTPKTGDYNLALNPYLHYFLKLWKCHTNIILLGLEIDRRIEYQNGEMNEDAETPPIVIATLKGSSSIRYVLAWMINQNPSSATEGELSDEESGAVAIAEDEDENEDGQDLENEPILNFIEPLARKKTNGGAISVDMRLIIVGLLVLYSGTSFVSESEQDGDSKCKSRRRLNRAKPLAEIGDLLVDLEYDDRFDEDIKYMLELDIDEDESDCECTCACEHEHEHEHEDQHKQKHQHDGASTSDQKEEEEEDDDDNDDDDGEILEVNGATANPDIQFDEFGRDWRDIPRGENVKFKHSFLDKFHKYENSPDKKDSDDFFTSWKELHDVFDFLCVTSIEGNSDAERMLGQTAINTIAKAVKDYKHLEDKKEKKGKKIVDVIPEIIHIYWATPAPEEFVKAVQENNNKSIISIFDITHFELMLHTNTNLARAMMDEMLMCEGHRRMLIWHLTHEINLSNLLIDYVFQLAAGLRGNGSTNSPYVFSRQGDKVILSDVELSMLLHEFYTNAAFYLSADKGLEIDGGYEVVLAESIAKKLMSLLCLMINQLIKLGIIKTEATSDHIYDYNAELSSLLIRWIGKVPDARILYFKIKSANYEQLQVETAKDSEVAVTMDDERALFASFQDLTAEEISVDLDSNVRHKNILNNFTKRMEFNLMAILSKDMPADLKSISEDFHFFLVNFNLFGKIERFVEILFRRFEAVVISGDLRDVETILVSAKAAKVEESKDGNVASEDEGDGDVFTCEFLNGKGKIEEIVEETKPKPRSKLRKTKISE